jgi:hypothetical protein
MKCRSVDINLKNLRAVFVQFLIIKNTSVVAFRFFFFEGARPAQEVDDGTSKPRCDVC